MKRPYNEFLSLCFLICGCTSVRISTKAGVLHGSESTSRAGRTYYSFTGIPYAKPPIGHLRLKNPEPLSNWEGELDATREPIPCTQVELFTPGRRYLSAQGEENCLYLNIYVPKTSDGKKLPVMFYIHGGGFRSGRPGPKESAAFFMDEDCILVTIQYRLGILGFLSTEDATIPGNFGLKDQAMALKWVKDNIDDFGGDERTIVAFGGSAGGASVHYLATSPVSRGFLAGAISQSGVVDACWALASPGTARKYAREVMKAVGCDSGPPMECLQSVPAKQLTEVERELLEWSFHPIIFQPVIEVKNEGAFMTVDPRTINVTLPWVTGFTNGEGNMQSAALINEEDSVMDYFVKNIDEVLPAILTVDPETPRIRKLLLSVKNRFFLKLDSKRRLLKEHGRLFFELFIAYPMKKALDRHTGLKYAYFFSHRAENSISDLMGPIKLDSSKASHGDELLSLFDFSGQFPDSKRRPEDEDFSKRLVKLWVDFTRSLNHVDGDFHGWEQYSDHKMLHFRTHEWKMEEINLDYLVDFWSNPLGVLKRATKDEL